MLPQTLAPIEIRVLGALIEKELSTPDHYPLSLNALVAACNQSSNRDPVMSLDESAVSSALDVVRRLGLVRSFQGIGSRVPKYQHLLAESAELSRAELAVLCVLALRGAQTMSEIRSRAARLLPGDEPDAIEAALEALVAREPEPAAARLPRRPGQKEIRFAHRLGGAISQSEDDDPEPHPPSPVAAGSIDRLAALETLVSDLRAEVADLRAELGEFRKQFE
jgi:uncharacterized protein YceH (UPF0502 family)